MIGYVHYEKRPGAACTPAKVRIQEVLLQGYITYFLITAPWPFLNPSSTFHENVLITSELFLLLGLLLLCRGGQCLRQQHQFSVINGSLIGTPTWKPDKSGFAASEGAGPMGITPAGGF